ncbi:MAG: type IX secretion system sortase PorU, partial [Bacteroidales bacterium]|nr:type IX secretion system sortase PorU [Bacteroidales bacterium]
LPYAKLKSLGFADPQKVRVFGNHDGMLPFMNAEKRTSDLHENKVLHRNDAIYFYATGPDIWKQDAATGMILPRRHLYNRKAFYFVTDSYNGTANSMPQSHESAAAQQVDEGVFWYGHEEDLVNLTMSGRNWYGENFFYQNSQQIDFKCNAAPKSGKILSSMICRSSVDNGYTVEWGDGSASETFDHIVSGGPYADTKKIAFQCTPQNSVNQNVKITFNKKASSAECYLDYVVINTVEPLQYNGSQIIFGVNGENTAAKFAVANSSNAGLAAMDISDANNPTLQDGNTENGTFYFSATTSPSSRYIVFDVNNSPEPEYLGAVANQNLHGIKTPEFLVVSPDHLVKYAQRIKNLHPELSTEVVSNSHIYNEFSSGSTDVSAIRDFVKYLYDKKDNGTILKYVLLFGDGSVDNLTISANNPNLIPTYQSESSLDENGNLSIVSDDYFGLLGDDEGETTGNLDVAIGRLPVKNEAEAEIVVNKLAAYIKGDFSSPWRKIVAYIADDENNNTHNTQADFMAVQMEELHPEYDVRKIYIDSYQQESSATGNTYPQARADVNRLLQQGMFSVTYVGHGGMKYFADERILTLSDINAAKNGARLPIFITASCNIGHFDYYDRTSDKTADSPAERLLLNPDGGAIALFTTTREVLSSPNFSLSKSIQQYMYESTADHGGATRLGDVIRRAKLDINDYNMLSFTLLGDPAMLVAIPKNKVEVESIDGVTFSQFKDTIKAMSSHSISLRVNGLDGAASGTGYIVFYDKPAHVQTLNNDGHGAFEYDDYTTKIFEGSSTMKDGKFSVKFTVPKDIDYNAGFGKLSLYATTDDGMEASGVSKQIVVGSSASNVPDDYVGPSISIKTSDGKPLDGANFTVSRPSISINLSDTSGINTAGRGHDIVLMIDDDNRTHTLTDYYTTAKDRASAGTIEYQLPELKDGSHTIRLKAWDNLNNSNEVSATFSITGSSRFAISHLLNYPNPFTDHTSFYFEQNDVQSDIEYEITIFTMSGKIVRTLTGTLPGGEMRCGPIVWDGIDNYGHQIARGVYFYRLRIRNSAGEKALARDKLLYLK